METPDKTIGRQLQLEPGARLIQVERLRLENDAPIMYSIDYVPRSMIPTRLRDIY